MKDANGSWLVTAADPGDSAHKKICAMYYTV